jgi:hypothetical protein
MLRALRVALVSSRPRRANLIDERKLNALIEQLRCAASRASPFEWITARWTAHDDDATIAALLSAMDRIAARHRLLGAR